MPPVCRWELYWYWLEEYKKRLLEKRETVSKEFRKKYKVFNEMREMEDTQIMKNCLVVGMTTTGAARLQSSLQALKSPIVIVEEAAEVLEAHIISSLTSHCKHLILIGDHQQLKPSTANYKIETKYLLGISLFERMVLNNIQCYTLNVQHRMRPEISCLIRPTIYPVLKDHESVLNKAPILGIENCVYFIDHQEPEQLCKDSSKKNVHEVKFLIKLAKQIILTGYKPENIIILVAYLGQMFEMQREKKQHHLLLQDVRIAVLDNYQGEESDIVLLSLVRNNNENKIGFLKIENRVCVALSRAKNGFYIMGNMTLLCNNSEIWPKIKDSLENQNAVGPYLTLRCQVHKYKLTQVKSPADFLGIAEGGCDLMCESVLGCGHICKRLCHIQDRDHVLYNCQEKCDKVLCENTVHVCRKLCYEECGPCIYPVERNLNCGHSVTIECHIDPESYSCTVLVPAILPCGHDVQKPCHSNPENFRCPHPCDVQVEPCGHACNRTCHMKVDPDHLQYQCRKPCARYKIGCSRSDDEKHLCSKFCFEECEECSVGVKKHRTVCSHVYTVPCKQNVDELECEKPCAKTLPCGHKCPMTCNKPCGGCKVQVDKVVPDCNHVIKLVCSKEVNRQYCRGQCPRLLECGHKCIKKCFETCTTFCKVKVNCLIPSPCGHTIKTISCSAKNSGNSEMLLKNCTERCNMKLKCDHICTGTCGECCQGRIHKRCVEKCGVPLICNHECPIPCRKACKPCERICEYKCLHTKCKKKCGDPCIPCKEQCTRKCEHQKCTKKCGDICNVPPCYKPCKRQLKCGHPCVGFCGDPCPILCRICNLDELTEIFLGNEDEENAIYVMLADCKHTFESEDLEQWLNTHNNEVKSHVCPKCNSAITTTQRYSEYIKNSMNDIMNVKRKWYGTSKENDKQRTFLINECKQIEEKAGRLKDYVQKASNKLIARLQKSRIKSNQMRRQAINKMDLDAIRSKLQLIELIIEVYGTQDFEIIPKDKSVIQILFILDAVMCDEDRITDQEIDDITLEIERLSRILQYEKIQKSANFSYAKTHNNINANIELISKLLELPKRYSKEIDLTLQVKLTELNKMVASTVSITEVEKKGIISALGLQKGHWFKCPNGHYYIITECGGAMQTSKCNECGVQIGGRSHQLLPGQRHAPEMDNSQYPAWSEAANLANYQI